MHSLMKKTEEAMVFVGHLIDFRLETKAKKVMVDFTFDTLYR